MKPHLRDDNPPDNIEKQRCPSEVNRVPRRRSDPAQAGIEVNPAFHVEVIRPRRDVERSPYNLGAEVGYHRAVAYPRSARW